ncbi:hypothetical protein H5410_015467 [Solanum commersonii]|uniref:Uncharacterized protein n=1 Tax=Solanum commersonii TaxID=4109 RepID=A0A9J5ZU64_SOLCO|nr:hypothetical protein H5410_015467 [Solanum commersonii]
MPKLKVGWWTKELKGNKNPKKNLELSFESTISKALTSHSPSAIEASDDEREEKSVDITLGMEWIPRVDTMR